MAPTEPGVILVMVAGIVVMWIYAFFGDVPSPARLDDRAFPAAAEPICARARADRPAAPGLRITRRRTTGPTSSTRPPTILDAWWPSCGPRHPRRSRTRDRVNAWLDDWDIYLRDRRDYTARLRADPGARFYVTQSERDRGQINRSLDNFARVNAMPSCAVPEDVV